MKAILTKDEDGYSLFTREENSTNRKFIATTSGMYVDYKLSKQNCNDLFGVVDINKFIIEDSKDTVIYNESYELGFKRAMELNKDKVFTLEDIKKAYSQGELDALKTGSYSEKENEYTQSLQQPTEIEVEIEMELHPVNHASGLELTGNEFIDFAILENYKPKLDENGCLILKKK
jgi:hypothetical protein